MQQTENGPKVKCAAVLSLWFVPAVAFAVLTLLLMGCLGASRRLGAMQSHVPMAYNQGCAARQACDDGKHHSVPTM